MQKKKSTLLKMADIPITILMPAYNAAPYIGEAIASVLTEQSPDFELLIIDDGSTDNTIDIINKTGDKRIRVIQQQHKGVAAALNNGLQEATGEYIARFDADDICLPGRLETQLQFLKANNDYVICGGEAEYIDEKGEHLFNFTCPANTHEEIISVLYQHCPFIHSSVMYRKDSILKAGGYSSDAHNFEDHLLWTRLVDHGKMINIRQQLIKVRFNPSSVTIDEKWRGKRFQSLKKKIIRQGTITPEEGAEIKKILEQQDVKKFKESAYHALCGKKFLFNNYQPEKARQHLATAIRTQPLRGDNYVLYLLSLFPEKIITGLYNRAKK
jgi:glycosyltransferase involved in cell wall biosynthesis